MSRIVVLGGNGFLGSRVVNALRAASADVSVPAFTMIPGWLARNRLFQVFLRGYFTVLRRLLLRSVGSPVELVAIAQGTGGEAKRVVKAADGMEAAGFALAAMAEAAAAKTDWEGVRFIDDVSALEPIVARANDLAKKLVLEVTE